jgi:predicted phosphoribosyltransferase
MIFKDRYDAGRRLAKNLGRLEGRNTVVLALVRGGLPVGYEIARALDAPLDIVLVRKIGAPDQPELAVGAVVDGAEPEVVTNADLISVLGIPESFIKGVVDRELAEIERRRKLYVGTRPRAGVRGMTAIVVDDGIATGATTRAALHSVRRQKPAHLVLAVPVAPSDSIEALRSEADDIECLSMPSPFGAIGWFYDDFHQVSDDEVIDLLARSKEPAGATPAPEVSSDGAGNNKNEIVR